MGGMPGTPGNNAQGFSDQEMAMMNWVRQHRSVDFGPNTDLNRCAWQENLVPPNRLLLEVWALEWVLSSVFSCPVYVHVHLSNPSRLQHI